MLIDILTIFPKMFEGPFTESMVKRAVGKKIVNIRLIDLRKYSLDKHHTTDDRPFGGGPGMIMMVEPIDKTIKDLVRGDLKTVTRKIILTAASGQKFTQTKAREYKDLDHLIIIAGHYEGVDQRVADCLVDECISIGDYVLTGGELPAMVIVDTVIRLIPGVLGKEESLVEESYNREGYREYPQYTRPEVYKTWGVPGVLLSGNHAKIKKWRDSKSELG